MPQGAGSHAVRGGALRLGAGRGTAAVRVEGGAQLPVEGLGRLRGGVWRLEEEPEQVEGGALGSESKGVGSQALGAGLQPRHEAELGPDNTIHLPECPGHSHGGRRQTQATDWSEETCGPLSHQV